ncbi:MAG: FxsA family protein [Gemmatimonadetes bacterium]|jgi:UPF0716 protein FxsA|nr:FxsA family protein [Gemmatimonadota bacterium]
MNLLGRLALLFVIVPLVELYILVQIGHVVGLLPTLGLVLLTGAAGAALARAEGLRVLWAFQSELARGRVPGQALQDGIAVLVGGAFLVTPGILTDLAGLALLFPPTRRIAQRLVRRSLERRIREGALNFVVVGPGMFAGGAGSEETPGRPGEGLDPSKEIRVDDPET